MRFLTFLLTVLLVADASFLLVHSRVNTIQCGISSVTEYLVFIENYTTYDISSNTIGDTTYANSQDCWVQFVTGSTPVGLSVYLEYLDLKNSTSCSYDRLLLKGAEFCGRTSHPKYFNYVVPANQTFTITFHTDNTDTATGFRLTVSTYETTSDAVSYEPYGVISNPNEITNYQEVNQTDYVDLVDYDMNNAMMNYYYWSYRYNTRRPHVNTIQCGTGFGTVHFLDAFENSNATVDISSNTIGDTTYADHQDCKVQFVTGSTPVGLSVYLEYLDLENNTFCSNDWLRLKAAKFCGRTSHPKYFCYVVPANQTFTITFHTDNTDTATGFRLRVSTYETTSDAVSYEPYGVISNPNEITNYQEVNQSDYVDLGNDDMYNPNINLYYSSQRYTTRRPYDYIIECSKSYYGHFNSNNKRYLLRSTDFGYYDYSNNTSCKVEFYTGSTRQRLTVYFTAFDVESTIYCGSDSLCMGGVKYCSTWPHGRYFSYLIPPYRSFTLDFETDHSIAKPGFEASLTFENAYTRYGNNEPTSGDGSNENTVVYSYVDENSYQDRCASDYHNTPTVYYTEPPTTEPRFDFEDSFVEAQLIQAEDNINVAEELIDNLD